MKFRFFSFVFKYNLPMVIYKTVVSISFHFKKSPSSIVTSEVNSCEHCLERITQSGQILTLGEKTPFFGIKESQDLRALFFDTPANLNAVASITVKQRWSSELGLSSTFLFFRLHFKLPVFFFLAAC